ncbi:MAG TPA: DUF192 domain-containing protein [Rubricoccaceae bacterium]|jgi:hypothetical protein
MLRLTALLSLVLLAGCRSETPAPPAATSVPFRIDGRLSFVRGDRVLKTIDIEIAATDSTRERGLMERREIPPDTGMLFVFDTAEQQNFYMASTPRSLDIQYYGPDSTLLNIAEDTVPYSFDTLPSSGPAQFVVEVPAGYSRRLGLVPGDRIRWTRSGETDR